jgi:dTDP-4-amino-4,6-dideoxygalactose transaminase
VIRASLRDELRAHLGAQGIGTEIYYPVPLHEQQCFEYLGYARGDCPASSKAAEETLALPIYPELTADQIEHVADRIASFYAGQAGG